MEYALARATVEGLTPTQLGHRSTGDCSLCPAQGRQERFHATDRVFGDLVWIVADATQAELVGPVSAKGQSNTLEPLG